MKEVYNHDALPDISLPVRCFTCNKTIGNMEFRWLEEMKNVDEKEPNRNKIIMERIGLKMDCCKKDVIAHMNYIFLKNK
jgi:DNA-directed RNA polymerase subunit N (RpoN/RPB10)